MITIKLTILALIIVLVLKDAGIAPALFLVGCHMLFCLSDNQAGDCFSNL